MSPSTFGRPYREYGTTWSRPCDDVENNRLNIDKNQLTQAEKELQAANAVLPRAARECYKWLLCPVQDDPGAKRPSVEPFPLNTTSGTAQGELERVPGPIARR